MADDQRPASSSPRKVDSWVALGAGIGFAIGAVRGNSFLWILIGAIAGLALAAPEDDS
jgi:hypothetical protein